MKFTDLFIRKPVLSSVVSLLIFCFGLYSLHDMPLRQYPHIEDSIIHITTAYPGADAQLMQGFITSPIEQSIASASGIDYIKSESTTGSSVISVHLKINYPPDTAFTEIMSKVAEVKNQLPKESQDPVISKNSGRGTALMYLSYNSENMTPEQITDYVRQVVQPKLETISGVSQAEIIGGSTYAMRIWLDPKKMAALKLSPSDVSAALTQMNVQSTAGKTKGQYLSLNIKAQTDLHSEQDFKQLIVSSDGNSIIRLGEVATVELGAENYDSSVSFNGQKAVFIGVKSTPSANPLTVIADVKAALPSLSQNFPNGFSSQIVYDATKFIKTSIEEVIMTIIQATCIVVLVIFLFLGSGRSALIPVVTIPLSLVGVCSLMLFLGYSVNLLTLLAMVLAIGLVVDDAIVVVENIHRHLESGLSKFHAAITGAREIAKPIVSMSITLAAVYAPIGFMSGLTGALFKEFAFTLAASVIISGIVALTLSPMLCSKLFKPSLQTSRFVQFVDGRFEILHSAYAATLRRVLAYRPVVILLIISIFASLYFLYNTTDKELAPEEDAGIFIVSATAPSHATLDFVTKFSTSLNQIFASFPETSSYFVINGNDGPNTVIAGMVLKPWNERSRSQQAMQPELEGKVKKIAGLQSFVMIPPSLPGSGFGLDVEFVVTTTGDYKALYTATDELLKKTQKSGLFFFVDSTLKFNNPEVTISLERNKAAELGISMRDVSNALATSFSGGYVNRFSMDGRSFKVIPQVARKFRLTPDQLQQIYVKTINGTMVPLSTIATISESVQPNSLSHFQQLHSSTIQGKLMPGKTIAQALAFLQKEALHTLPEDMSFDYAGKLRQYVTESDTLALVFFFALIIIYLVLSAQFESFKDPLIILISVPMSILGALIPLNLGMASMNIYTQIGLITLIGLITKHGILIVDFANHAQMNEGLSVREAIIKAAQTRLRPILMTTAAMVFGVMPLVFAKGAGAESRYCIGLVISFGMTIGTLFTLFVLPTLYTLLAHNYADKALNEPEAAFNQA